MPALHWVLFGRVIGRLVNHHLLRLTMHHIQQRRSVLCIWLQSLCAESPDANDMAGANTLYIYSMSVGLVLDALMLTSITSTCPSSPLVIKALCSVGVSGPL